MVNLSPTAVFRPILVIIGKALIRFMEFTITPFVNNKAYQDNHDFPWVSEIESRFDKIKAEYEHFISEDYSAPDICLISKEQNKVVQNYKWNFIPLYLYGSEITSNTALFPETRKALSSIPSLTTAFFSILQPHTFIKEHRGAYKGYLRYQLGIRIPEYRELCAIKIQGKEYHWEEGKSVIFDDTLPHAAWNHSEEIRTVLYVDFIRPMPVFLMKLSGLLTILINRSPYIQDVLKNLEKEKHA